MHASPRFSRARSGSSLFSQPRSTGPRSNGPRSSRPRSSRHSSSRHCSGRPDFSSIQPSSERLLSGSAAVLTAARAATLALISTVLLTSTLLPTPAAAQTASGTQRNRPPVSLTGCLKAGGEPQVFLLTSAVRADEDSDAPEPPPPAAAPAPAPAPAPTPAPSPVGTPTSPPAAAPAKAGDGRIYRIVPLNASVDVKSHVGEQVEVGGRVMPRSPSAAAEKTPTTTVAVAYVRRIASTCGAPPADR